MSDTHAIELELEQIQNTLDEIAMTLDRLTRGITMLNPQNVTIADNGTPIHYHRNDEEKMKWVMTKRYNGLYVCVNCGFGMTMADIEGYRQLK